MDWQRPDKPAELSETRLISAILNGTFPAGGYLPAERELAHQLGVTRPTLRETLQRLSRDGWIEVRHGKSTRVRDIWREGNLATLCSIARHTGELPKGFVTNLLSVRVLLAPAYTRLAVERQPGLIIESLQCSQQIPETPQDYASFDWQLHRSLTIASGNPFYTMFINSVEQLYQVVGAAYFNHPETRSHSAAFYRELHGCVLSGDFEAAYLLTEKVMCESRDLWRFLFVDG